MDSTAISRADALYVEWFHRFRAIFTDCAGDVSKTRLIAHMPEEAYRSRAAMGAVISAAILAMLDKKMGTGGESTTLAELPAYPTIMPPEILTVLDEIIVEQGKRTGTGLLASDIVMTRVLEWEKYDRVKTTRWLRALDKAARVQARETPVPLDDPFRRMAKRKAVEELRPAILRLQKWFKRQRVQPSKESVVEEFQRIVRDLELPFTCHDHNFQLWTNFARARTLSLVTLSPERLFDEFAGFVEGHDSEYTRKKYTQKT
jgi:hypothetical protein